MANAAVKGAAYCLNHTPELGFHYGTTPYVERREAPGSAFLGRLAALMQPYDHAARYAPNLTYIGTLTIDQLQAQPRPWRVNLAASPVRFGRYGEIMPEDEFLGMMAVSDVFDLIWLESGFAAAIRERLAHHPILPANVADRMKPGADLSQVLAQISTHAALPLHFRDQVVGCCRRGHETDEALSPHVMLENLATKAGGLLALFHLLHNAGLGSDQVDFVIECSEEAAGDMNQRGGGNFAKAIAEGAGCVNASGLDVRAFCAGPVDALITGASLVASGASRNVVVLAGGSLPKLFMNAREHVKKELPALETCLGNFAVLLAPDDGTSPVIRLDALGKHTVGAGSSPQAVTTALVWDPLQKAGLEFADVDRYAAELHNPEITVAAGAGDVAEANAKMIAALAVMKGQLERTAIGDFVAQRGVIGFAQTQGHIPSGVPFLGHAVDAIATGAMRRAMIIGKGSLFLARLTNLSDGASFMVEAPPNQPAEAGARDDAQASLGGARVAAPIGGTPGSAPVPGSAPAEAVVPGGSAPGAAPRQVDRVRAGAPSLRLGLMAAGSELGPAELLQGALLATADDPALRVVAIGPRVPGHDTLEWIETPAGEQDLVLAMEAALAEGRIDGAVALHYPFPVGIATIGRVLTPARRRPLLVASCTGMSASGRTEAMVRNAVYGIAVAKALGLERPTVGILNVDGAISVKRALERLSQNGYSVDFARSVRADGGPLLRGNDVLAGGADLCVCDTLSGNVIVKLLSAFDSGGAREAAGWGYGPSVGADWTRVVSIVSRLSGAPVVANALWYTASVIREGLPRRVEAELAAAKAAGLDDVLHPLAAATVAVSADNVSAPRPVPTDSEIPGIDVLSIEEAVQELWKAGIYAESAMGCSGPVIKLSGTSLERAREVLSEAGYL
jgi:glycine/sarcosine/betaine reductase complex component C subunit beta